MLRRILIAATLVAFAIIPDRLVFAGPFGKRQQCQCRCAVAPCFRQSELSSPTRIAPPAAPLVTLTPAAPNLPSTANEPKAPAPTRELYFTYPFGASGPERHDMWDAGPEVWFEKLPNGDNERFTVLGRWTEYSSKGTLARKDSNPDLFIFLPDADQPLKQLLFRMAGSSDWASLGEISELSATKVE